MADAAQSQDPGPRFGTFQGVFRPTALTILGAMLYLREGWLVGNDGLLGALLVLVAAYAITGTTALSAASIATNQRVRPGGAFAIISQALGLEAGGAIGVPLYIAQSLSAAMYAYAFAEAFTDTWQAVGGAPLLVVPVALAAFVAVSALAWRSAALAFRAQGVLLLVVLAALLSLFLGFFTADLRAPHLFPVLPQVGMIDSFAIFFPAATGIMVGIGMSGELHDPRRSIPIGTMGAWAFTFAIYALAAVWYSMVADPTELMFHRTIAFDRAAVGWVVRLGLLVSTLTASLSSLVAASHLLHAMAEQDVVPGGHWLGAVGGDGEPRWATRITTLVAALGLLSGSLDAIAPIITAFFILTYLALNLVVAIEQQLQMISFRPTFAIPPWVPSSGVVVCAVGLFFASPRPILVVGLFAVTGLYVVLARRELDTPWETVRSGVNVALATWAARRAAALGRTERAWKPDLLVPLAASEQAVDLDPLLKACTSRNGSVKLLGVGDNERMVGMLHRLRGRLAGHGIYATTTRLSGDGFSGDFRTALDAMQGDLFPPNLVVLDATRVEEEALRAVQAHCLRLGLGLMLFVPHPGGGLGKRRRVDVWLSSRAPDWALEMHTANLDLPVLLGYLFGQAWEVPIRLVMVLRDAGDEREARALLRRVVEACRLPDDTVAEVQDGDFLGRLAEHRATDVHLFGLGPTVERDRLLEIARTAGGACLFLMDSGRESAFA